MNSNSSTQLIKRCRVCGDQAICFNFDVLTCGPCRLFFYRNVNKPQKWKCFGSGKCEISSANRRACRKCRWDKCVAIGMKPKQITQNDNNLFLNQNIEMALKSALEEHDEENSSYSNEIITSLPKSMSKNYFEFNQTEMKYIDELLKSSASIFNFEETNLPVLYEASTLYETFNLGMNYVRRIIKFCKTNSIFRSLNSTEQYQVLKQFINKFLMIRQAFSYDAQIDGFYALGSEDGNGVVLNKPFLFNIPDPTIQQFVEMKKQNFVLLNQVMSNDKTIRDLLIVQALFSSTQHLSIAESLRYHYWIYNNLLHRYLQCKYKDMEQAQFKHSLLIKVAQESKDEAQEKQFHDALQELDINQFDELTVEVLSI